eukprot:TRINITY_DN12105_c0_g1_i9.p1 TRINITY_DN12105_c0_g1~~TRINITY_DN12105_c0_g1_i9.p1  ORF type:complete len:331 (+),score=78.39 TRINITY_DN12105_c0_g1_i9:79-1071(+)
MYYVYYVFVVFFFFLMIRRPPRSTLSSSSAASDVYKRQPHVDAVEINVGCPQRCAKKGGYGAFLMSNPSLLCEMVRAVRQVLPEHMPVLCKIRVFEDVEATVELAQALQAAGCGCLTVHGRTREQGGGKRTGRCAANWDTIRAIKQAVDIPVVSNGNIQTMRDVQQCREYTKCDAVMSGCGVLADPRLFEGGCHTAADRIQAATEYCCLVRQFPAHPKQVRTHLCDFLDHLVPGVVTLQKLDTEFIQSWDGGEDRVSCAEFVDGPTLRSCIMGYAGHPETLELLIAKLGQLDRLLSLIGLKDMISTRAQDPGPLAAAASELSDTMVDSDL